MEQKSKGEPYTELDYHRDMARESILRIKRYKKFVKNLEG